MIHHLKNFAHDRRGNFILIAALALPVMFIVVGGAVDFAQNSTIDAKIQEAADSAALAAMAPEEMTDDDRKLTAQTFIDTAVTTGDFGDAFDPKMDVQIEASEMQVTVTINGKSRPLFSFFGGDPVPFVVKSVAVPDVKQVPAAVDVVVGLDGGCGNEDEHRKLQAQTDSVRNLMNALRSSQNGRRLIYSAAIWSGADQGGNNSSWDHPTLTENLEGIHPRINRPNKNAHGGTNMANVMNEMFSSRNSYFSDTREQKLQDKKYRIGIVFEGAHHETDSLETWTNNMCASSMKSNFDGVYVVLIDGGQEKNSPCSRGRGDERKTFPGSGSLAYNIQYCQKAATGMSHATLIRSATASVQGTMSPLAQQIADLKVTVRAGAKLTQ